MPDPTPPAPDVTYHRNGNVTYRAAQLDGEIYGHWKFFGATGR